MENLLFTKKVGRIVFNFYYKLNHDNSFSIFVCKNKSEIPYQSFKAPDLSLAESKINLFLEPFISRNQANQAWKSKKKEGCEDLKKSLEIGSILFDSWGYEQTNIDFYKVVWLNKNRTKIRIVPIGQVTDSIFSVESMSCHVLPDPKNEIGDIMEKQIRSDRIKIDSSVSLRLWDGKSKYTSSYY